MKLNRFCLHFSVPYINFVTAEHNRNIFTNSYQISMPVRNIFVSDSGGYIKHDDGTLPLDVVTIAKATKLLLAGSVPNIESDWSLVCVENQGVYLYTNSSCNDLSNSDHTWVYIVTSQSLHTIISLVKFSSTMTLHKCCLPSASISN